MTPSPNQKDLSLFLQANQVNTPIEIVPPSQQVTRLFAFWSNSAVNKGEYDQGRRGDGSIRVVQMSPRTEIRGGSAIN